MLQEDEKPPAPPIRLTSSSNLRGGVGADHFHSPMRPLPKEPDKHRKQKSMLKKEINHKPEISSPINFEHTIHVKFDAASGEFTGLPPQWLQQLNAANISKQEQKSNPQAILDVLHLGGSDPWLVQPPSHPYAPPPSTPTPSRFSSTPSPTPPSTPASASSPLLPEEDARGIGSSREASLSPASGAIPPPIASRPERTKSI
ncbi:unnamed protein product, partial [Cyprideis torosa]